MISCGRAWIAELLDEGLADLVRRNWKEAGLFHETIPLCPDWAAYRAMEEAGSFLAWAARVDGRLAGYAGFTIGPHIQYSGTIAAQCHVIYVAPEFRAAGVGLRFIRAIERDLQGLGVSTTIFSAPIHTRRATVGLGDVLERLGYKAIEIRYAKVAGRVERTHTL